MSDSDSSSEDEIAKELLESVDKSLMNNSLFSNDNTGENGEAVLAEAELVNVKLPSLRNVYNEDNQFSEVGVTKSQQTFIAKRLSSVLDTQIKEVYKGNKYLKRSSKGDKKFTGGVTLFSNSVDYLDGEVNYKIPVTNVRKGVKNYGDWIDESELDKRCKVAAVSPEWILSGASTKGWFKNTKGKVVQLKQKHKSKALLNNIIECEIIE